MIMVARRFSLLRQLVWAATLATGFGALWFVLMIWLTSSIQEARQARNRPPYESLVVRSDGTILIQSIPLDNLSLATFRDLNGQVQDAPDRNDQLPAVGMSGEHRETGFLSSQWGWHSRLTAFVNEREPTVNWFFVHDEKPDGAGYFVAYERTSNRRVGFIGMSGFRTDPVPMADWIPASGELKSSAPPSIQSGRGWVVRPERWDVPPRQVYVPSGTNLRRADLDARTIASVLETHELIVAAGVPTVASWSTGHPTTEQHIFARTTQHIRELDQKDRVIRVFTIPTDIDRRSAVQWYQIASGQAIAVFATPASPRQPDSVSRRLVYRIASDGAILDRSEVNLRTGSSGQSKQTQALGLALGVPAPAVLFVVNLLMVIWDDQIPSYPAAFTALLRDSGPALVAVLALSLILAVMAWRRSREYGISRREQIAWAVFVLLLGLPAYVGFRLYRSWPVRQPCPNCQAQVPRDRMVCAECGTLFPDPALKGIEIFA